LARDKVSPAVIREWCRLRCLHGKNKPGDPQIREALECAEFMEVERDGIKKAIQTPVVAENATGKESLQVSPADPERPKEWRVAWKDGTRRDCENPEACFDDAYGTAHNLKVRKRYTNIRVQFSTDGGKTWQEAD